MKLSFAVCWGACLRITRGSLRPSIHPLERDALVFLGQVREAGDTFRIKAYMNIVVSICKLAFADGDLAGCHAYAVQSKAMLEAAGAFWNHFRRVQAGEGKTRANKMRPLMVHAKTSYMKMLEAIQVFETKKDEIQNKMPETCVDVDVLELMQLDLVKRLHYDKEIAILAEILRQTIGETVEGLEALASELKRGCNGFQMEGPEYWRKNVSQEASLDDLLQVADSSIFVEKVLKPKALGQEVNKFVEAGSGFFQTCWDAAVSRTLNSSGPLIGGHLPVLPRPLGRKA